MAVSLTGDDFPLVPPDNTTRRPRISDKMWWQNLDLSLIHMLLVTKLISITIESIISGTLINCHRMHL